MEGNVHLLIYFLVTILFAVFAFWGIDQLKLREPFRTILMVVVFVLVLLIMLSMLGVL